MFYCSIYLIVALGLVQGIPPGPPSGRHDLEHFKILRHNGPLLESELGIAFDKIGTLEIRLSKLTGLSKEILSRFTNLENLTISYTHMGKVEDDVFSNCCPKLKNLEIEHWQEFDENDLKGIGTLPLESLGILDQDLPKLKAGNFQGTKLKSLSFVRDNIEEIEDGAFSGLDKLEYLLISNNKLKTFPKYALKPLKNLETLELASNGLEKFSTENLPELPNLTDIVFIRENLKEINLEGYQKVTPKLADVFLIGCKTVHIPSTKGPLKIHNWN